MARVTVEDCVLKIPNRFELVLIAGQRARDIASGSKLTVERDNDKNPVVALREIADEMVPLDNLRNALVTGLQKHVEVDEPEDDDMESFMPDSDIAFENMAADEVEGEDGLSIGDDAGGFEDADGADLGDFPEE